MRFLTVLCLLAVCWAKESEDQPPPPSPDAPPVPTIAPPSDAPKDSKADAPKDSKANAPAKDDAKADDSDDSEVSVVDVTACLKKCNDEFNKCDDAAEYNTDFGKCVMQRSQCKKECVPSSKKKTEEEKSEDAAQSDDAKEDSLPVPNEEPKKGHKAVSKDDNNA